MDFMFLRPWWLLALLVIPVLILLRRSKHSAGSTWQRAVDPHLLPHLLETRTRGGGSDWPWVQPFGAAVAIVALAGPSWQQVEVPLWRVEAPLVIAIDLSSAMQATDQPPSRLVQARHKLGELLKGRRGGEVGLIAYAGDAFTAAPLTRDAGTVQLIVDSLAANLMPVDGQRADRAIGQAVALMTSAGFKQGDILLVTDHADRAARDAAQLARSQGFRVSALGVGTTAGAPITGARGFVSDSQGRVQFARLDLPSLKALATAGGGQAAALTRDTSDLTSLGLLEPRGGANPAVDPEADPDAGARAQAATTIQRSDDGYWLVLLLLPLGLLGFRRGALAALPLLLTLGTLVQPTPAVAATARSAATAADPAAASTGSTLSSIWASLWQRPDQRARAAFDQGDLKQARVLAPDASLRGAAAYRGDDYAAAAREFAAGSGADARYNLGNALARAGQYENAIDAYDEALKQAPGMADALANRKAVENALKKQQQNQQSQSGQQQDNQSQSEPGQDQQSPSGEREESQAKSTPDQGQSTPPDAASDFDGKASPGEQTARQDSPPPAGDAARPDAKDAAQDEADNQAEEQAKQQATQKSMEQAMSQALQQPPQPDDAGQHAAASAAVSPEERTEAEHQQALQQWLRRVPDDPGGWLREKFAREYARRQASEQKP